MPRFAASLSTLYGEHDFLDRFRRGGGRQLPSFQGANRMTDQLAAAIRLQDAACRRGGR
jgi:hydroxypyruvate isomerase